MRKVGYCVLVPGEPWNVALHWNLWRSERRVSLYLWRLLIEIHGPRRTSWRQEKWTSWTAGSVDVTWFKPHVEPTSAQATAKRSPPEDAPGVPDARSGDGPASVSVVAQKGTRDE